MEVFFLNGGGGQTKAAKQAGKTRDPYHHGHYTIIIWRQQPRQHHHRGDLNGDADALRHHRHSPAPDRLALQIGHVHAGRRGRSGGCTRSLNWLDTRGSPNSCFGFEGHSKEK